MSVERFLQSLGEEGSQLDKLLRLQAHLRNTHARLAASSSPQAAQALEEARALQAEILERYHALEGLGARLRRFINRLPQGCEREILGLLYLRGMTLEQAARIMGYSVRHCYRIRRRALEHLEGLRA